ncbi:MAG: citrate transporter, partial [Treponema sp.]|nr:citrate transporter [Treponema sp.]
MLNLKWIILAIAVLMYVFVIAFQSRKVWFTTAAAILVIALGFIFPNAIFALPEAITSSSSAQARLYSLVHSFRDIINWNVLMIYLGSMIIAALFIYSKV